MDWEEIKKAIVLCEGGTGYLVTPTLIVTCAHVVEHKEIGAQVKVTFAEELADAPTQATVIKASQPDDCAILELSEAVDWQPLPLASQMFFRRKVDWECYGYPEVADIQGVPLEGQVRDVKGKDKTGAPAIILYAEQAQGENAHGFSGSPVLVQGLVIGHLKRVLDDDKGNAQLGILYACPFDKIRQCLPPGKVPYQKAPTSSTEIQSTATAYQELLADVTARYHSRYEHKLDERFEIELLVEDITAGERMFPDSKDAEALEYILKEFQAAGRLLILGSPGAGKTVLLLRLAEVLAHQARDDQAKDDNEKPIPIIFNLASWTSEKPWHEWVQESFVAGYGISKDSANQLLREKRIIFLLDGLDELARNLPEVEAAKIRAACMKSLNEYLSDGRMQVVICCRRQEFQTMQQTTATDAPVAVKVTVKDLTLEQINAALEQASATDKNRYAAKNLKEALKSEHGAVFADVLKTPFYFTTALEVFDNSSPKEVASDKAKTLRQELRCAYVEKKLKDPDQPFHHFSPTQTQRWLNWLARKLSQNNCVTFELTDLQPTDLKRRWLIALLFYVVWYVCLCVSFSFEGIRSGWYRFGGGEFWGRVTLLAFVCSIIWGIPIAIAQRNGAFEITTEDIVRWEFKAMRSWHFWITPLLSGVLIGLCTNERFINGAILAIVALILVLPLSGAIGAALARVFEQLAAWIICVAFSKKSQDTIERIGEMAGYIMGGLAGVIVLIVGVKFVVQTDTFIGASSMLRMFARLIGSTVSVAVFVAVLIVAYRKCRVILPFVRIQSAYSRLRNRIDRALLLASLKISPGVIFWGILLIINDAIRANVSSHTKAIFDGMDRFTLLKAFDLKALLFTVLLPATFTVILLTPFLQHFLLRFCLWMNGAMPWRYVGFLDYATKRRLLERDGGQWRFQHQHLQDYFAELGIIGQEGKR